MQTAPTLGVITTDRQLSIRGWNEWVANATGLSEAAVLGRPLLELVAPERLEFYRDLFAEVLDRGVARALAPAFHKYLISCTPREPSAHFTEMQQRVTVAPLTDETHTVGVMITLEDVTARLDRERGVAAMMQQPPGSRPRQSELALSSDNWRVRGAAVRHLKRSASLEEVRHLLGTLRRDHQDLNVLNSALRVLISSGRGVVEPLLQMLSDVEPNLRMHAALALGELHAQEAAPLLVSALEDPDDNVRFHAIEALGRLGSVESIDPLSKIAASDNFFLAFAAIEALSKCDDARVAPLMVQLLDQDMLRPAAIETLAAIGDEDCVPALARALSDPAADPGVIAAALVRIHERYEDGLGAGSFLPDMVRHAMSAEGRGRLETASRKDEPHRAAVATVLGWLGTEALEPLIALVGEPAVHTAIADNIVALGADAVAPLIVLLETPNPAARRAAAEFLGRIGDRRALPSLLRSLDDADTDVVAAAATALGALGAAAALDALFALFGHPNAVVRRAAVAAVNGIGASGIAARARAAMAAGDPHSRECAIRVAGYFGFEDCVPGIVEALRDPEEDVRRAAIEQLPVLEHIDADDLLQRALTNETPRNRGAAAHALRLLDDPRAGVALKAALADTDPWVRYYAAMSLGDARFGSEAADDLAELSGRDPATHVRIAALTALGAMHGVLGSKVAAELVGDDDDDLAIAAIGVLGAASRTDAHDWLTRAAHSSRLPVQLAAIRALAMRSSPDSVDVLSWAARLDDEAEVPAEAIDALRRIASSVDTPVTQRAAVAALRALAAEGGRRREAIAAIARLPEQSVPEVASGLSAMRVADRVATADALAAMRHPRASSELSRALRDEDPAVRVAAITGFARLGTPAVARTIATMRQHDPDPAVRRQADVACVRHGWGTAPGPRQ